MKIRGLIYLFILFILFLPIVHGLTAAIGNARAIINIEASPEDPAVLHRTILVQNRNEIAVKISVKVDERFEKFVDILDKEFILEPDESKKARYTLTMDRGGNFDIKINVAFEAADPDIKENKVGMVATLIVNSKGPIIDEPDEEQEEISEIEEDKERNNPFLEVDNPEFEQDTESEDESKLEEKTSSISLAGILEILVLVCIGFFIIILIIFLIKIKR